MSRNQVTGRRLTTARVRWAPLPWFPAAALLFLASAVMQHRASPQRWIVLVGLRPGNELSVEDHRLDHVFPSDPWENFGTAAQQFGTATLLLALGVLAMAVGTLVSAGAEAGRGDLIAESVAAFLVARCFGVMGAHALISGAAGTPSVLRGQVGLAGLLSLVVLAGLVFLAVRWRHLCFPVSIGSLFLLGSTVVGDVVASLVIAPFFAGYTSHDTTPWTESVIAASTAAAGIAMCLAGWTVVRRHRRTGS